MKSLNPAEFVRGLKGILKGTINIPDSLKDNEVLSVLLKRRSVRSFQKKDIPDDVLTVILEAGRLAPSGVNMQSWTFGVFDPEMWHSTFDRNMPFAANRAVIILGDMHRPRQAIKEFPFKPLVEYSLALVNAGIAAYAMNIAAEACGVGSVMLSDTGKTGFYDAEYLAEKMKLPEGVYPVTTIVFGYPKGKPLGMPPKLPLEAITFSGSYKETDPHITEDWLTQMQAGFRASKITHSFKSQLKHYLSKIDEAEKGLANIVFYRPEEK
jgi:nitroreductase